VADVAQLTRRTAPAKPSRSQNYPVGKIDVVTQ
jgi:hypothetical protein